MCSILEIHVHLVMKVSMSIAILELDLKAISLFPLYCVLHFGLLAISEESSWPMEDPDLRELLDVNQMQRTLPEP